MGKTIASYCYGCRKKVTGHCDRSNCPKNNTKFANKKGNVHPWYQSKEWRGNPNRKLGERGGIREAQLRRQPNCVECEKEGVINPATVVDHKKDWKKGRTKEEKRMLFTNPDNLQSLCHSCHNRKTAKTNKNK